MSTIFGINSNYLIYCGGVVAFLCLFSVCCYYFVARCFATNRRALLVKHLPVEVLIVEKVVEEEKFDPGPPRELTRRELKKQREREMEKAAKAREALGTAVGTADGSRPGTHSDATETNNSRWDGNKGLLSCFFGGGVTADTPEIKDDASGKGLDLPEFGKLQSEGEWDIEEGINEDKKNKKKKAKEEKKVKKEADRAAAEALEQKESKENQIKKAAEAYENDMAITSYLKQSSSKHHDAAANREARRQKIKDAEEKKVAEELLQKFLDEETPEQRQKRLLMEKKEKMDKEQKRLQAIEDKRQLSLKESLFKVFGRRRSSALVAPFLHHGTQEKSDPDSISLFDIDPGYKGRYLAEKRLEERMELNLEQVEEGILDCVTRNSGPPATLLPEGQRVMNTIPDLTIEVLQHRRIMIYMEEGKSKGWFIGTVSGYSKRPGFNFSVKFDKAETASIDIDGIKACMLFSSGENAYGLRWVLLENDPAYVSIPSPGGPSSRPVSTTTTGV